MNILLDTCALLWLAQDKNALSAQARACLEDTGNTLAISAATLWEIVLKYEKGALDLPDPPKEFIETLCALNDIHVLTLLPEVLYKVPELPRLHKDPFDRLLIMEAIYRNFSILTSDRIFAAYDVEVIPC